ncbi:hypothetical protein D9M70_596490 [compost metagenome]
MTASSTLSRNGSSQRLSQSAAYHCKVHSLGRNVTAEVGLKEAATTTTRGRVMKARMAASAILNKYVSSRFIGASRH